MLGLYHQQQLRQASEPHNPRGTAWWKARAVRKRPCSLAPTMLQSLGFRIMGLGVLGFRGVLIQKSAQLPTLYSGVANYKCTTICPGSLFYKILYQALGSGMYVCMYVGVIIHTYGFENSSGLKAADDQTRCTDATTLLNPLSLSHTHRQLMLSCHRVKMALQWGLFCLCTYTYTYTYTCTYTYTYTHIHIYVCVCYVVVCVCIHTCI